MVSKEKVLKVSPEIRIESGYDDTFLKVEGLPIELSAYMFSIYKSKYTREGILYYVIGQILDNIMYHLGEIRELREAYNEAEGHCTGSNEGWWIEIYGHYYHPLGYQYDIYSCPSKRLPYLDIEYIGGSPTMPSKCKLSIKREELEKLYNWKIDIEIPIDGNVKQETIVFYKDYKNNIIILPNIKVEINENEIKITKYGLVVIDLNNKVFVRF